MSKTIKLSIQEIVNDFYSLGQEEGYLSGLTKNFELEEKDVINYHNFMIRLIDKYIPNWKDKIENNYWESNSFDEKGLILSTILFNNFKEIFCELV